MANRILVVDDDIELQDLVGYALKREGYEVIAAKDAFEGLEIIEKEEIDLALLDIMMPKMDGLEMLSRLRTRNKDLRVIVMTALTAPEAAVSALRDHASDFLTKPFDITQLISAVKTSFELAPHGIRVNALAPDLTMTEGLQGLAAGGLADDVGAGIPLRRAGHVDEIAAAAVFLASDMASYITGQTIHVDGGTEAAGGWYFHPGSGAPTLGPGRS